MKRNSGRCYSPRIYGHNPMTPLTSLRKSCDHCHTNKLKCSPGTSLYSACQRCQQAGHLCKYSARLARRSGPKAHEARLPNSPSSPSPRAMPLSEHTTPSPEMDGSTLAPFGQYISQDNGSGGADWPWWAEIANSQFGDSGSSNTLPIDSNSNSSLSQVAETDLNTCSLLVGRERENFALLSESRASVDRNYGFYEQYDDLLAASQALEAMLHCVTVEWPRKDIEVQHYPIGELFSAFDRLTANLAPLPRGPTVMDECLRTKKTFLAAYAYITCVKIMGSLAKTLRRHLHSVASSQLPEKSTIHSSLKIDDLFSRINPYMYALASCCATLRIGLQHLRQIEVALSIPRERGVASANRLSSIFVDASETARVGPISPAYLLIAFWDNERGAVDSTGASATILEELLQCCIEMFDLGREYRF
ncbi:uncharacterized protein PAC_19988 [Phialocephala subalpina]|uniref:Zn(2)-C6 fungal-type domain-containing protein n=1 Tax=Phialocephala subalpina TaxID=576137 RepID=A0A1L7XYI7_9HELO|nr:uncharacterized protein PAC_19988 [Phialocephala subalpina]